MKLKTVLSYHPFAVSLIEDLSLNHRDEPSTATEFSEFFQAVSSIEKLTLNTRLAKLSQREDLSAFERPKTAKKLKGFGLRIHPLNNHRNWKSECITTVG